MSRYLDPKADVVFKKIFGEHPDLLKSFLNAVLPLPQDGKIVDLEYLSGEQVPVIPEFKATIVDVKCKDQHGRIFIVEMQIQWVPSFMQRMLFGASTAYVRQLDKGEDYHLLQPVYGLGLIASIFDHETPDWYHHYKLVNIEKPEREIKDLQLVFIELPKFKPASISQRKLQVLWLRFMSELNAKTVEVPEEWLEVPEIKEAVRLSEEAAYTPVELEAYEKYWDAVSTQRTLMTGKYAEGKAEGKAEGLFEGELKGIDKTLQALKLLAQGQSVAAVAEATGLSLAIVEQLSKK